MKKITKIESNKTSVPKRLRVAAYCRVSMETERLNHSLSTQISYYSQLIQANPEWEYAGVYSDSGISGTSIKHRLGFQEMLTDCEAGKIDIILTKSIQRFARNTVDLLETVRHLKSLGIEVRFEKENINSLSGDGELMLSILASFAQEESRSLSENLKWAKRKGYENGRPNCHFNVYGYVWQGDSLIPVPEEAEIIQYIYSSYLNGWNKRDIARSLSHCENRKGYSWNEYNVGVILGNSIYTGELVMQKQFVPNGKFRGSQKTNRGELPQYIIDNHHEAIVSKEDFDAVQARRAERAKMGVLANEGINTSCLTRKIRCSRCGDVFFRGTRKNPNGEKIKYWKCASSSRRGSKSCGMNVVLEEDLKRFICDAMETSDFNEDEFNKLIKEIIVFENRKLQAVMNTGEVKEYFWEAPDRKQWWTEERRKQVSQRKKAYWTEEKRMEASKRMEQRMKDPIQKQKCLDGRKRAMEAKKNANN